MAMVAYSPIARGNANNDKVLAKIGAAHEKTAAQVCLRYLVSRTSSSFRAPASSIA